MTSWIGSTGAGVSVDLLVQPRASKNEVVGLQGGELKVRLTSPPVEGAANRLCCEFLAKKLRVAKKDVELIAGEKSRHKRVLIRGVTVEQVEEALGSEL